LANRYPLDKPATKAKVMSFILEGLSDGEIAAALSDKKIMVSRQAVWGFRQRHAAEIAPVVEQLEKQITDYAISQKVNRIADLDNLRNMAILELRATGYAWDEIGKNGVKRKVSGAVADLKDTLQRAAEELDQLPRGTNINIDNRSVVLVRERVIERGARLEPLG
jgi:hypothetical protein